MKGNAVVLMSVATAVSLSLCLSPARGGDVGQGDGPLTLETLQVNYESGQGYGNLTAYRPGEIIVQFDPNVLPTERHRIVQDHGCRIARTSDLGDFHLVRIPATTTPEAMADFFGQHERVRYAELNYYVHAAFVPDDKLYSYQWNFENAVTGGIRMNEAWAIEEGDPNVVVAVVDTGVAYENYGGYTQAPDLAETRFVPGYDFVNDDNHPNDDNGHGTHVTGTIAESTNNLIGVAGVAFRCSIMPVKVMDDDGLSDAFTVSQGILFAVNHGAHVINLSFGSPQPSRTLQNAVQTAYQRGVTVVAAAGNDGANGNPPSYPAAYTDYCIAVGAVRYDLTRAPYSTKGSYISVVAPGGDTTVDQNADGYPDGILQQTFDDNPNVFAYWFFQGTSMAAPHVSGLAALLVSHGVTSPDQVRTALETTARDLGPAGWDAEYGWGMIDAHAALAAAKP
ncbi:MAG: S8 family peptidase [Planctomycetes bacterium]|nr:S8 family peptidase [Planctomycetota bacterium]